MKKRSLIARHISSCRNSNISFVKYKERITQGLQVSSERPSLPQERPSIDVDAAHDVDPMAMSAFCSSEHQYNWHLVARLYTPNALPKTQSQSRSQKVPK